MSNESFITDKVHSPFYEALFAVTNTAPPDFVKGVYHSCELDDEQFGELQEWAVNHGRVNWFTGIGIIDAADTLVLSAVDNGNIPPGETCKPKQSQVDDFEPLQGTGIESFPNAMREVTSAEFDAHRWRVSYSLLLNYLCDELAGEAPIALERHGDYLDAEAKLKRLAKELSVELDIKTTYAAFLVGAYVMQDVITHRSAYRYPRPTPPAKEVRITAEPKHKLPLADFVYPCGLRIGDHVIGLHETGRAEGTVWAPTPGHSPFRVCVCDVRHKFAATGITASYLDPKNIGKATRDGVELFKEVKEDGSVHFVTSPPEIVIDSEPAPQAEYLQPLMYNYPCGLAAGDQVVLEPFTPPVEVLPSIGGKHLRYLDVGGYENQAPLTRISEAYRNGVRLLQSGDVQTGPSFTLPTDGN